MAETPSHDAVDAALDAVIAAVRKRHGPEAIARLSDEGAYAEIRRVIPTGLKSLDGVFGTGGLPLGKLIEIFGPEHALKSTLAKHLVAMTQRAGFVAHEIDTEQSGARVYDESLGIRAGRTLVSQLETLEVVFDTLFTAISIFEESRTPALFVWDSLAATPLQDELERPVDEEGRMAARALFLSRHMRTLVKRLKSGDVGVVVVNQVRERIGALPFQKTTYSPGGRALRHYAHVRIEMTPLGQLREGSAVVGLKVRARAVKNKIATPFKEAELHFRFDPPRFTEAASTRQPHDDVLES